MLMDMREGQPLNPLPSNVRLSRLALARSMAARRWRRRRPLDAHLEAKQMELENGEWGFQVTYSLFLAWKVAACTGEVSTKAEGYMNQPAQKRHH